MGDLKEEKRGFILQQYHAAQKQHATFQSPVNSGAEKLKAQCISISREKATLIKPRPVFHSKMMHHSHIHFPHRLPHSILYWLFQAELISGSTAGRDAEKGE